MKVYGPYLQASHQRRFVIVVDAEGRRKSTAYARYLMEQQLGRMLLPTETVDHIDENPLNDDLGNLQILSMHDNIVKSKNPVEMVTFACPVCKRWVSKIASKVRHNRKQGKAGPFCGKRCSRAWQIENKQV